MFCFFLNFPKLYKLRTYSYTKITIISHAKIRGGGNLKRPYYIPACLEVARNDDDGGEEHEGGQQHRHHHHRHRHLQHQLVGQ